MKISYKDFMLLIITLVSGLLLSGLSYLLQDNIKESKALKELKLKKKFFPMAKKFEKVNFDLRKVQIRDFDNSIVYELPMIDKKWIDMMKQFPDLNLAVDENGGALGYIFKSSDSKGYGGEIVFIVALNLDFSLKDFSMLKHAETPGLGTNVEEEWFKNGFIGKIPTPNNLPTQKSEFKKKLDIDAISGATLSSMATVRALGKKTGKLVDWYNQKFFEDLVDLMEKNAMWLLNQDPRYQRMRKYQRLREYFQYKRNLRRAN